jgi:hypothetical protein
MFLALEPKFVRQILLAGVYIWAGRSFYLANKERSTASDTVRVSDHRAPYLDDCCVPAVLRAPD